MVTAAGQYDLNCDCPLLRRPRSATAGHRALLAGEKEARSVLEASRQQGEAHRDLLLLLTDLADMLSGLDRMSEAEAVYREALAWSVAHLEDGHPDSVTSLLNLADVLRDQGRLAEAEALYIEALAKCSGRERGADIGAGEVGSMRGLAELWFIQGKYVRAEGLLQDLKGRAQGTLGAEHPYTMAASRDLVHFFGTGLLGQGSEVALHSVSDTIIEWGSEASEPEAPCPCAIDVKQDNI